MSDLKRTIHRRTLLTGLAAGSASLAGSANLEAASTSTRLPVSTPGALFYDNEESREVSEALESRSLFRWYGPGKPVKVGGFETAFGRHMGARYSLAVSSGTAALHCAVTALGAGPGDEVILPAWAWYSCYNAIIMAGALPVFAECDESLNIDPADLEKKITPQTKAVMVLHLYGAGADMDRIMAIAHRRNISVLEDTAQGWGARYKGKRLGTIGHIGIYSFQIAKTITAGEGGAVVTDDPVLFERVARFSDLGLLRPAHQEMVGKPAMLGSVGVNYRMNEMTGAVMSAQLRKLDNIVSAFRHNAQYVRDGIQNLPGLRMRRVPDLDGEIGSNLFLFFQSKANRNDFLSAMRASKAIASAPNGSRHLPSVPYIEKKLVTHPAWPSFNSPRGKAMRYGASCCPHTVDLYDRAAAIPIGPKDTKENLDELIEAIRKSYRA